MPIEVAAICALIAGAGWLYLRLSRRTFEQKYGKEPIPEGEQTEPAARAR